MQPDIMEKYASDISSSEIAVLENVLKNYDFHTMLTEKVRSAYKVYTDIGIFCLKRVSHGYRKAKKGFYISKHLKDNGFNNLADYYYTKDGNLFVRNRDAVFYLTYWIEGREANFRIVDDLLRCSELLADFHNQAKGFKKSKHVKVRSYYNEWNKHFEKCMKEMQSFKSEIDKLSIKAEFDYMYRSYVRYFSSEAELAISMLKESGYKKLSEYQKNELYICHDSFYYQNVLIDKDNKMLLIDMESCCYNLPMSDLGKFIRRVLSKGKYKWDFDLCRRIIESYNKIRPVSKEEYTVLLAMLVFPHKFWKLGRKRYIKNKMWNEEKYKKKLRKLTKYSEYKKEFIKCFISFYGLKIKYNADTLEI